MAPCTVVKQFLRIEDVIGHVVPLKRRGAIYIGRCPFHDDHHPPRCRHCRCNMPIMRCGNANG